jgi:hypothetical protein
LSLFFEPLHALLHVLLLLFAPVLLVLPCFRASAHHFLLDDFSRFHCRYPSRIARMRENPLRRYRQ